MKILTLISLLVFLIFASCHSKETRSEFEEMREDLDEASKNYCDCMINADSTGTAIPNKCKDILNEKLLDKCGSNDLAREYVKEAIIECVESRAEMNDVEK